MDLDRIAGRTGQTVINNTHLYLAECDGSARGESRAPDKIEGLHAQAVVVGHGVLDPDSCPRLIEETRRYIREDSKKYAATGGWGFAQFTNGKPADEALLKTCFPCHEPVKARDFVFTHYAP